MLCIKKKSGKNFPLSLPALISPGLMVCLAGEAGVAANDEPDVGAAMDSYALQPVRFTFREFLLDNTWVLTLFIILVISSVFLTILLLESKHNTARKMRYAAITENLIDDYDVILYCNPDTDSVTVIKSIGRTQERFSSGIKDNRLSSYLKFFSDNILAPDDRERIKPLLTVDGLLRVLDEHGKYIADFEVFFEDGTRHNYQAKISRYNDGTLTRNVVIAGQCTDSAIEAERQMFEQRAVIQGIASDFESVTYVDIESGREIRYRESEILSDLIPNWSSTNGYNARRLILEDTVILPEERERYHSETSRRRLLAEFTDRDVIVYTYKVRLRDGIHYYQVKYVADRKNSNVVGVIIGFVNVDAERTREEQYIAGLARAKEAAETANHAKSEFLSHMSHDIRTPINGVIGMTEIAKSNVDDPERIRDCLSKIETASHHLLSLINDVLDMTRIESGKANIDMKPFDIMALVETCDSIMQGQLSGRDLKFTVTVENTTHPRLIGDELHIRQVLLNILGNAVKYTPDGGQILFAIEETECDGIFAQYKFECRDTGVGMKPEFMKHIFESFAQEDSGSRTTYAGTGLGMAITKQLVDMMGGDIEVQSTVNEGSTFTVTLPITVDISDHVEEQPASSSDITNRRVLLVEDNDLNREIAQIQLTSLKMIVDSAVNGRRGLEMFEASQVGFYDAILMDVMMPEMDGLAATRAIRGLDRPDAKTVPIIAMTANAFEEDVEKARAAGMNLHLPKPVETEVLQREIAKLVH